MRYLLPAICCLLILCAAGETAEPESDVALARQSFLREMRKKSPAARVEAIATFARYPVSETAEALLRKGLADRDPAVRVATRTALRDSGRNPKEFQFLCDDFKRHSKKQSSDNDNEKILTGLLGGMIAASDADRQAEALRILDDYLAAPRSNLFVPMSLIDDLALVGGADSVESIIALTHVKPFASHFGYRRCVVQALSRIRAPASIGFLIQMLPDSQGLVQAEIIEHLTATTKQTFKDNDRDWAAWWKENQARFQFPSERLGEGAADNEDRPSYYGVPICAKRVVFVLDTSVSMRGQPLDAAKRALLKTVESLPEAVSFDIVMFDQAAAVWQPRLLPATQQAKRLAADAVIARGMKIGTASHAALNAAFNLDPEVIYFLSDGEPTDSKPEQIVESISERNRVRRISIHTIGVVTQRGGGTGLTFFMKPLAEYNFGSFQLVP